MTHEMQLLVLRRGLDPTAWSALHTLAARHPEWPVGSLARGDLWEFAAAERLSRERLARWVETANWFANPTRDRLLWRPAGSPSPRVAAHAVRLDGGVGGEAEGGYLLVVWREAWRAEEYETLSRQALGESVTIRRGTLWWLGAPAGADTAALAALAEAGASGGGGLLVHPESQWGRWHGVELPCPAIGRLVEEVEMRLGAGR
jgi:hypothetical protein